jgi:RNA-directed DNA polymerase
MDLDDLKRRVTGIILGSDGRISVGRSIKWFIRHQIHQFHALSIEERTELAGYIAYAQSIDPDIINSLILKYGLDLVNKVRFIS